MTEIICDIKRSYKVSKLTETICDSINKYLLDSINHERKKSEIRKKFNIKPNAFRNIIIILTWKYPIYEDDSGHILGILERSR